MEFTHALFTIDQLGTIGEHNIAIGLRPVDEGAVETITADMQKYGFDLCKSGEFIVSISSHHLEHFVQYFPAPVDKIWNVQDPHRTSVSFVRLMCGDKENEILSEVNFIDGRHRVRAVKTAFAAANVGSTMMSVKVLVDVEPSEARILSYQASRQAVSVQPCFLDEISCLLKEQTDDVKPKAARMGVELQDLEVLATLKRLLSPQACDFVQRWRTTGLFSLRNITRRKNKSFWKLIDGFTAPSIVRRGPKVNFKAQLHRLSFVETLDFSFLQVLSLAVIVCLFRYCEQEEYGINYDIYSIIDKACSSFQTTFQLNNRGLDHFHDFANRRAILSLFWYSAVHSLRNLVPKQTVRSVDFTLGAVMRSFAWDDRPKISWEAAVQAFSELDLLCKTKSSTSEAENADIVIDPEDVASIPLNTLEIEGRGIAKGHETSQAPDDEAVEQNDKSGSPDNGSTIKGRSQAVRGPEHIEGECTSDVDVNVEGCEPLEASNEEDEEKPQDANSDSVAEVHESSQAPPEKHEEQDEEVVSPPDDCIVQAPPDADTNVTGMEKEHNIEQDYTLEASPEEIDVEQADLVSPSQEGTTRHPRSEVENDCEQMEEVFATEPDLVEEGRATSEPASEKGSNQKNEDQEDEILPEIGNRGQRNTAMERKRKASKARRSQRIEGKVRRSQRTTAQLFATVPPRVGSRKRSLSTMGTTVQPPRKRQGRAKKHNAKAICGHKCLSLADDLLEKVQIGLASPNEGQQTLASLPQSSEGTEWAIFFSSFDECFKSPISSLINQISDAEIAVGAVFIVSSEIHTKPPARMENTNLKLASQSLYLSQSWNGSLSDIQESCIGHCLVYSKESIPALGVEFECIRVDGTKDSWSSREYLKYALKHLADSPIDGIIDLLVKQTDLLQLYPSYRSHIQTIFKVVDYYFDGRKSTAESSLEAIRRWVLGHCTCGGHSLLSEENQDQYNTHPQKNNVPPGVTRPFLMNIREEDSFGIYRPFRHYSVYLNSSRDTSNWDCQKEFFDNGQRVQQGAFISHPDFLRARQKKTPRMEPMVWGEAYIVDCESGMRDYKQRLSPFELRSLYVAGLTDDLMWLFFTDASISSKFNQHNHDNMIAYEAEPSFESLNMLLEKGLGYLRTCHLVVPTLNLKLLKKAGYVPVQCQKCQAVELFVHYGPGYRFHSR